MIGLLSENKLNMNFLSREAEGLALGRPATGY